MSEPTSQHAPEQQNGPEQPTQASQHPESQGGDDKPCEMGPTYSDDKTYHPIFCLCYVPPEYFSTLKTKANAPLLEISSSNPKRLVEEIKANMTADPFPHPFLGQTIDQVYEFYKEHMRPPQDEQVGNPQFTSFTFLVIDDECVKAQPPEIIVCCDAPEYGDKEGDVNLQVLRWSQPKAMEYLCGLEQLSYTPTEVGHSSGTAKEAGTYLPATPMQARLKKQKALAGLKLGPNGPEAVES